MSPDTTFSCIAGAPALRGGHGKACAPSCDGRCFFGRAVASERMEVEEFIRRGFERAYRARITQFMPALLSLRRDAKLVAACGLRAAAEGRLFLETYLDLPVEEAVTAARGRPLARAVVAEVGNLVGAGPGHARRLIVHLTSYLRPGPTEWVVFTAVPALRNSFARLGIPLVPLGAADGSRLKAGARSDWGTYYDQGPCVIAVEVAAAYSVLRGATCTQ